MNGNYFADFYSVAVFDKAGKCVETKTFYAKLEADAYAKNMVEKYSEDFEIEVYAFYCDLKKKMKGNNENENQNVRLSRR